MNWWEENWTGIIWFVFRWGVFILIVGLILVALFGFIDVPPKCIFYTESGACWSNDLLP